MAIVEKRWPAARCCFIKIPALKTQKIAMRVATRPERAAAGAYSIVVAIAFAVFAIGCFTQGYNEPYCTPGSPGDVLAPSCVLT